MSDFIKREVDNVLKDITARVHFVGLGGSGMSALAQFRAFAGGRVSGSDRDFDRGQVLAEKERAEALGIQVFPQDGRGVQGAALVVASTAVESSIPDLESARSAGIPVAHRAEYLAGHVRAARTVAVTGTSGKSTVTAMIFAALRAAGREPGLITGGELNDLRRQGLRGNAFFGPDELVIEADESDKSLVHYAPAISLLLNLQLDHDQPEAFIPVFKTLRSATRETFVVSDDPALAEFRDGSRVFGLHPPAEFHAEEIVLGPHTSSFRFRGIPVQLSQPGEHNVFNAVAALTAVALLKVDLQKAARGLQSFGGVHRRFESLGCAAGVEVIDDFAHNPTKVSAVIAAARRRGRRVLAVFHPHGFGPMRLLRQDLANAFSSSLGPDDRLFFADIYYAGGTAVKDISSGDLAADARRLGVHAEYPAQRQELITSITEAAGPGDVILSMGARNPTLPGFAREIFSHLERRS